MSDPLPHCTMRIGTWNLDAKWTPAHAATLDDADCDVWLLTELVDAAALPGYAMHRCGARMARGQHYAAVASRLPMTAHPDPHPASAAVQIAGTIFCASVLPWAAKDDPAVWGEGGQGDRTRRAVDSIAGSFTPGRTVWGGDFNHALAGPTRWSGSAAGRAAILGVVETLELSVPTADLPHRLPGIRSIDHIAVPASWTIVDASRREVFARLSDHDCYVVTASGEAATVRSSAMPIANVS